MSKSSKVRLLPVLSLPSDFRIDLSIPQGVLFVHPEREVIKGLHGDVTIGDVVSNRHFSSIKIRDFKTKRSLTMRERQLHDLGECAFIAINPPGSISLNSLTVLEIARAGIICVIGEEDLLVIPFLRHGDRNIIYGQPDSGAVLVKTRSEIAIKVFKILKPTMVKYEIQLNYHGVSNEQKH
ncbi:MAG: DUF359 domain-containing protein [Desulfurococcaceae archaeon]